MAHRERKEGFVRCNEKGCPNYATFGEKCVSHKGPAEKPISLPEKDFEIVPMSAVPTFVVKNERNYKTARAIEALQDGHALKVRQNGHGKSWPKTIVDLCRKLGIKDTHSRTYVGVFYFWREKVAPGRRAGYHRKP